MENIIKNNSTVDEKTLGVIYKICSKQTDQIYVGKTIIKTGCSIADGLEKRLAQHRAIHRRHCKTGKSYTSSIKMLEHSDNYIEATLRNSRHD